MRALSAIDNRGAMTCAETHVTAFLLIRIAAVMNDAYAIPTPQAFRSSKRFLAN
jgi:hypothetical protein